MMHAYWTVVIPHAPREFRTQWHPDSPDGPFAVLTRGAFPTETAAVAWARERLNGTPYNVRRIEYTD